MAHIDFDILSHRIDQLITQCQHLRRENETLKDSHRILITEHEALKQKQTVTKNKIETMLNRLKTLESSNERTITTSTD